MYGLRKVYGLRGLDNEEYELRMEWIKHIWMRMFEVCGIGGVGVVLSEGIAGRLRVGRRARNTKSHSIPIF